MSDKSALTLIAAPDKAIVSAQRVEVIGQNFAKAGAKILATDWLAEGEACDMIFSGLSPEAAEECAREVIGDAPIDLMVQETGDRKKQVLVTDMDSTVITIECIDELADFAGIKPQVAAITERAMNGELDFKQALTERVRLLKGLPESALQQVYDERLRFMPGAKELVATMRANGAYCVLVSGGFTFFTSRVREVLGFHADFSNRLEIKDGLLTGEVIPPILDKDAKLQALIATCQQRGIGIRDSIAIGDGANDLPMILAAGLGVAYHAKPSVQNAARARIQHGDLRAALYAQGYRKAEIVSSL